MEYNDKLICRRVPRLVRERTKESMEVFGMSLGDAFKEAAGWYAEKGTELFDAWMFDDYRKFIPSAYTEEYLDFDKYPLKYKRKG